MNSLESVDQKQIFKASEASNIGLTSGAVKVKLGKV